ncbi:MAG: hypothetical protein IPF81_12665 [Bacteroidetes bacterium]|nr:hypothetical protein [Bacteroidota bacterium]
MTRKQIVILSTGLFLMLVGSFTIFINLRQTEKAYAAVNGEYRSAGSGAWNLLTTCKNTVVVPGDLHLLFPIVHPTLLQFRVDTL